MVVPTYKLTTWDEQNNEFISLSDIEFKELKSANANLVEALFVEQKMDIVIETYLEWENAILASSARHMVQWDFSYFSALSQRDLFSRRIMALLTACRGYLDHTAHHISNIYGNGSCISTKFKKWKTEQYDSRLGYRVMEELRDYVQHRGWPLHAVSHGGQRLEFDYGTRLRFSTGTVLRVTALKKDSKFKKSILDELGQRGDQIELQLCVREYIAGLSVVHQKLRDQLKPDVTQWDGIIYSAIDRLHRTFPRQQRGTIFALSSGEEVWLSPDYIEARRALEQKNRAVPHLPTHFVTNEIVPK